MIECEDPEPNVKHDARVREMYLIVMKKFLQVISRIFSFMVGCYLFGCVTRLWLKAREIGVSGVWCLTDNSNFSTVW